MKDKDEQVWFKARTLLGWPIGFWPVHWKGWASSAVAFLFCLAMVHVIPTLFPGNQFVLDVAIVAFLISYWIFSARHSDLPS